MALKEGKRWWRGWLESDGNFRMEMIKNLSYKEKSLIEMEQNLLHSLLIETSK